MVPASLAAAETLAREGIEAEVVDLRTLLPLDEDSVLASVAKTHRAILVHEDSRRGGVGAELAALIAERALYELEAPVIRVASPDLPVPYAPSLEAGFHPGPARIAEAVRALVRG
jgi:pyruvate dehydrogenase E1 component beta subunit